MAAKKVTNMQGTTTGRVATNDMGLGSTVPKHVGVDLGVEVRVAALEEQASSSVHPVHYVRKFHEVYGHPIENVPVVPEAKMRLLRVRLTVEEVAEFCRASGFPVVVLLATAEGSVRYVDSHPVLLHDVKVAHDSPDLVDILEVADGLGDINVVNNGAALTWGIPIERIDAEIHRSNMSKLDDDGKPITDEHGKTMKGPNFKKPDIKAVLLDAGFVDIDAEDARGPDDAEFGMSDDSRRALSAGNENA